MAEKKEILKEQQVVDDDEENQEQVEESVNLVGAGKAKKSLTVVIILAGALGAYYFLFYGQSDSTVKKEQTDIKELIKDAKPVTVDNTPQISLPDVLPDLGSLVEVPSVPEPPAIVAKPAPVALPPPPVVLPSPPVLPPPPPSVSTNEGVLALPPKPPVARRSQDGGRGGGGQGGMLLFSGGRQSSGGAVNDDSDSPIKKNAMVAFSIEKAENTSASRVIATKMPNRAYLIAQGKMIDAIMESAINSDLDGVLRAVVTHDVYAEIGTNVLIPKGSRLIGNYSFSGSFGETRIDITWSRIIMPHGVDIAVGSSGVDEMGRKGITGYVDNKITNMLISTITSAGISIATAAAIAKIPQSNGNGNVITETVDALNPGKTTTSTTSTNKIISDSAKKFSDSIKDLASKFESKKPTIYVDQGTLIKVFVAQDLLFPTDALEY